MPSIVEPRRAWLPVRLVVLSATAALAAGCSADVSRFEGWGGTQTAYNSGPQSGVTGSVPYRAGPGDSAPVGRVESQPLGASTASSSLPPPPRHSSSQTSPSYPSRASAPAPQVIAATDYADPEPPRRADPPPRRAAAPSGGLHAVAQGETLHSIARQYDVPVREIAQANDIRVESPIRVGQAIRIPGVPQSRIRAAAVTPVPAASRPEPQRTAAATRPTPEPRRAPALQRDEAAARPAAPERVATRQPSSSPSSPAAGPAAAPERVEQAKVAEPASAPEPAPASTAAAGQGTPTFRWPVRGRVIAGFGAKPNGQRNDGINLSVPAGTSIRAAEDGVVAYAGNELKGYGNLVLVRHENGYVTAYAHASELRVKRGDTVRRGQIIALAGQTGNVTSPQLHFEIRRGSTPVDPVQYLASN